MANKRTIDCKKLVEEYVKIEDWRVKENSTVTYSVGGLILNNSGAVTANYWLNEIYDDEIAEAHTNADIHIHDLSMLSGYCAGWSLRQLIQEGLGGVTGKISSLPAKHLNVLCNQMVNFLGIMQNEWAGAQAFSSFDTYLAPFVKVDNLNYYDVKKCIEAFVYGVNTPSRWGTQAPFSNITLDWTCPPDLAEQPAIVGGKPQAFKYKDCKKEMDMVNKAFIEIMIEGDANGRGFQYPIPTYSITRDFDWSETENNKLLFEMAAKYGTPYFSNYINSDMEPSDVRSMCVLPDTLVDIKTGGVKKKVTIEDLYNNFNDNSTLIKSKYGYQPIKEYQRFTYKGEMLRVTTDTGRVLTTTPDHPWIVFDGKHLVKIPASMLKVGSSVSCAPVSAFTTFNKTRKGKTFEQIYGKDKALALKQLHVILGKEKGYQPGAANPSYGGLSEEQRVHISQGLMGHYVSENCKKRSSDRFKNYNANIKNEEVIRSDNGAFITLSKYEKDFAQELESLGVEFEYQYGIEGTHRHADFYIPSKNLVVEMESERYPFSTCSYNTVDKINRKKLRERVTDLLTHGFNVLVFNPRKDDSSYREYINSREAIVSIEPVNYDGYVYDVEVDVSNIYNPTGSRKELAHSFYANGILTGNCCRLRLNLRELRRKNGGFFGSGESTGSVGVVTLNLPRLAYLSENEEEFYTRLDKLMDVSARSLKIKRDIITKLMNEGLYPYTKRYLGTFDNHFSTVGLVGMNEAGLNAKWLRANLTDPRVQEFAKNVLNHMRERLVIYQEKYGDLYNLEATPAESTTYRLAKHDKERYPDIITANENGTPYYTNSSHLPVGYTEDVFSALDIQDELQTLYTSGTVFHTFLGEKLPDWKAAAKLVRSIAENYKLPYFTLSPTYSICRDHGYIAGEVYECPKCGRKTEVNSRITGYYRPVQNWNDGKAQEFKDRLTYNTAKYTTPRTGHKIPKIDIGINSIENNFNELEDDCRELLLFTTPTCPKCKIVKPMLEEAHINFSTVDATADIDKVKQFKVMKAPTLVCRNTKTNDYIKYIDIPEIKKFIDKNV